MASPNTNPYQAPLSDYEAPPLRAGDFSVGRSLSEGFEATKRYFPLWLGVGVLGALLSLLAAVTIVGYFLVLPVLSWGLTRFLLNMIDGRAAANDLFAGFSKYGSTLGRSLLLGVCFAGMILTADSVALIGQLTKSPGVQLLGTLLYLGLLGTVVIRFYFAMFFMVDRDLGAIEALSASWNASRGKNLKMLGLALVGGVLSMAGLLALLVGVLFTMTMAYAAYASAYRQVAGPAR